MGKKKDRIRRKAIHMQKMQKKVPPKNDDYAQIWMLICKSNPDKMTINQKKKSQPQRPDQKQSDQKQSDPKLNRSQYKQYNRPYRGEEIYLPDEWE